MSTQFISQKTQKNWWIDTALFGSAIVAALSGIYFLFLPKGGFQGGRNPLYNIHILFTRQTWDDLHTWGGIVMILAAIIHLAIHWPWVVSMARRTWNELTGKCGCMNTRGRLNLILIVIVAISFALTAVSGVYLLFVPGGRWVADIMIVFTRTTWVLIHTWAGVALTAAAVVHFSIHWKWATKVTRKMIGMIIPSRPVQQTVSIANS
jgi:preprotein translocase subunit SecY